MYFDSKEVFGANSIRIWLVNWTQRQKIQTWYFLYTCCIRKYWRRISWERAAYQIVEDFKVYFWHKCYQNRGSHFFLSEIKTDFLVKIGVDCQNTFSSIFDDPINMISVNLVKINFIGLDTRAGHAHTTHHTTTIPYHAHTDKHTFSKIHYLLHSWPQSGHFQR